MYYIIEGELSGATEKTFGAGDATGFHHSFCQYYWIVTLSFINDKISLMNLQSIKWKHMIAVDLENI